MPEIDDQAIQAGDADRDSVAAMLARAFQDDPAMSYIFPDSKVRARRLPPLFAHLFDEDRGGMRWRTAGGEAATLWQFLPEAPPAGLWATLRDAPAYLTLLGTALPRALRVRDAIEAHYPPGMDWRLHIAGCDRGHQGKGHGGRAIRAGLARVDLQGAGACLETATPGNVALYRSLGFEVVSEWRVGRNGPIFWTMARPRA